MIFPTVHLNGTSKQALLDGYLMMTHALEEAILAMVNEGPNARDYYVQDGGGPAFFTFHRANEEHARRIAKVKEVRDELMKIVEHIANAEGGR